MAYTYVNKKIIIYPKLYFDWGVGKSPLYKILGISRDPGCGSGSDIFQKMRILLPNLQNTYRVQFNIKSKLYGIRVDIMVEKLRCFRLHIFIFMSDALFSDPGSTHVKMKIRIQGSKNNRVLRPDPDPQHCGRREIF